MPNRQERTVPNGIPDHVGPKIEVTQTGPGKPGLAKVRLAAHHIASVDLRQQVMLDLLNNDVGMAEAGLDTKQVPDIGQAGVRLFLELGAKTGLERVTDLVFSPDEGVASRRIIDRALNQNVITIDHDRRDADTRNLP